MAASPTDLPAKMVPALPRYRHVSETQEILEWAYVPLIDFSMLHSEGGTAKLVSQVRDAMRTYGFICIINHGLMQAQNDRMMDIADVPFTQVPLEEQRKFVSRIKDLGEYKGYKPLRSWHIENGVHDQVDQYMVIPPTFKQDHPKPLVPFLPEIRSFMEHNHFKVLHPLLKLLALGLELPENTFVDQHRYQAEGKKFVCFSKYYPRSDSDEEKTKNVWMKGHTDGGTVSLLWSQPIIALQLMSPDGNWRYVQHVPNGIIVNLGDAMEMLSGGYYKAAIHRVFQPPSDQRGYPRLGLFYFAYTDDDVRLVPYEESPVLQRVGIRRQCDDKDAPTMKEWSIIRATLYGNSETTRQDDGMEVQMVDGLVIKHWN
ncbi:Clavaminate synthase-like protein, partial [Dichomitus squalens]